MLCATMKNRSNIPLPPTAPFGLPTQAPMLYDQSYQSSQSSGGSQKRGRGEDEGPSEPTFVQVAIHTALEAPAPPSSTPKKSRPNSYEAPRVIKASILTAMGSLVGGVQGDSNSSVPMRRRLSGGALEDYIGGHDNMEMDTADSRPRSMSF
jgi:hypothetical protein